MDMVEFTEVCRLCPNSGGTENLLDIFDETVHMANTMKEVIFLSTGVQIRESDLISKKICIRCYNITLKMFRFRQDALKMNDMLKEKCQHYFENTQPNEQVAVRCEEDKLPMPTRLSKNELDTKIPKVKFHTSEVDVYEKSDIHLELPHKCLEKNLEPIIPLSIDEVDTSLKKRKPDKRRLIYNSGGTKNKYNKVIKKKIKKNKTVAPLKIKKKVLTNHEQPDDSVVNYFCVPLERKKGGLKKKRGRPKKIVTNIDKHLSTNKSYNGSLESMVDVNETKDSSTIDDAHVVSSKSIQTMSEKQPNTSSNEFGKSNVPITSETGFPNSVNESELVESLGLMAQVMPTKSQTLLVCAVCGSVHYNGFDLKRHKRKHMLCQFCKIRFTSLEAKVNHVENSCQIKKILSASNPSVILEKIDLNIEVRKKYMDVFSHFEPIPGLLTSDINVESSSESTESIIDLSNDEELKQTDPLSVTSSFLSSTINSSFPKGPENKNGSLMKGQDKILSKKNLAQELISHKSCSDLSTASLQKIDNKNNQSDTYKLKDVLNELKRCSVPLRRVPTIEWYNPKNNSKSSGMKIGLKKILSERTVDNRHTIKLPSKSRSSPSSSLSGALLTGRELLSLNLPVSPLSPLRPQISDEVFPALSRKKANPLCSLKEPSLTMKSLKSVGSIDARLKNILTHTKKLMGTSNSGILMSQKNGKKPPTLLDKAARSRSAHAITMHDAPKTPLSNRTATENKRSLGLSKSNDSNNENCYIDYTDSEIDFKVRPLVQEKS